MAHFSATRRERTLSGTISATMRAGNLSGRDGWRAWRFGGWTSRWVWRGRGPQGDRSPQAANETVDGLVAPREAYESRRRRELGPADRPVGHRQWDLDERFDAA